MLLLQVVIRRPNDLPIICILAIAVLALVYATRESRSRLPVSFPVAALIVATLFWIVVWLTGKSVL
jgi:hypothetical protein